jgi:hypothetical protein
MDALPPPRTLVLMTADVAKARHRRLMAKHPIFVTIMVMLLTVMRGSDPGRPRDDNESSSSLLSSERE